MIPQMKTTTKTKMNLDMALAGNNLLVKLVKVNYCSMGNIRKTNCNVVGWLVDNSTEGN